MPFGLLQAGIAGVAEPAARARRTVLPPLARRGCFGAEVAGLGGRLCWNRSGVTGPLFWATCVGAAGSAGASAGASEMVACATWVTG